MNKIKVELTLYFPFVFFHALIFHLKTPFVKVEDENQTKVMMIPAY